MEALAGSTDPQVSPILNACPAISLSVQTNDEPEIRLKSFRQSVVSIGRRSVNDVVLDDLTVSGRHAEIVWRDGAYKLRDLESRNGILIGAHRLSETVLENGVAFRLGIYTLTFRLDPDSLPTASHEVKGCVLEYLNGGMRGIKQRLEQPITRVSAHGHVVVISRRKTGFFVTHLEGARRPAVNGHTVDKGAVLLGHNDVLELNSTRIRFRLL